MFQKQEHKQSEECGSGIWELGKERRVRDLRRGCREDTQKSTSKGDLQRMELKFKNSKNEKGLLKKWRKRRGFRQLGDVGFSVGKSKRKAHSQRGREERVSRFLFEFQSEMRIPLAGFPIGYSPPLTNIYKNQKISTFCSQNLKCIYNTYM